MATDRGYRKVAAVYEADQSGLTREQQVVLKKIYEAFQRNGVGPAKEPNPAQNYMQREYNAEDFGEDFFEDLTRYAKEATT